MSTEISTLNEMFSIKTTRIGDEDVQTISAREIHERVGSQRKFSDWIKERIDKYGFVEGQDFTVHKFVNGDSTGQFLPIEYEITLDMAKELGMVEGNNKGREVRQYFIAAEKEMRRLQGENTKLLEKQTRTLQLENKTLANTNVELADRNEYLEDKKAMFIDDHLRNCALSELNAEMTERRRLEEQMYLDECGDTSLDVKGCIKFVKQRVKATHKHLADLEKCLKKSGYLSTIEMYTDRIRDELGFYRNW